MHAENEMYVNRLYTNNRHEGTVTGNPFMLKEDDRLLFGIRLQGGVS